MGLKDISIKQYQQITRAIERVGDNEWEQWAEVISIIEGNPVEHYKAMLVDDFKKLIAKYSWVIDEQLPLDWVKEFECKGERFIVIQRTDQWDVSQFISMGTLTRDRSQIPYNLHQILAVLCVKEKGEFVPLDEFNRRAELFQNHLDPVTGYPIALFYAAVLATLSANTRASFLKKRSKAAKSKRTQKSLTKTGLVKSGVGTRR